MVAVAIAGIRGPQMISLHGVCKRFGGVQACQDISFKISPGDVIAIAGENGAGKSTVSKCLYGLYSPTEGHIEVDGIRVEFGTPADGEAAGIVMIPQELDLFPELSISNGVWIGQSRPRTRFGSFDYEAMEQKAREHLLALGLDVDVRLSAKHLSAANGKLLEIAWALAAGDPGVSSEPVDPAQRHWRFRDDVRGKGAILGEVSSHAHHLLHFIFGEEIVEVSAEMSIFVPRRIVYDNAYLTARYASGAVGRIWGSYVAAGNDHGLRFRIFGETGGLTWDQEDPEVLWFKPIGGKAVRIARGYDDLSTETLNATRFRSGHPEGYALAFANLYADFGSAVIARKLALPHVSFYKSVPTTTDGVVTLSLIEAANASQENNGQWTSVLSANGSKI